jgi:tRNA(Ile2) C34 agmatinyltransferase TiaS
MIRSLLGRLLLRVRCPQCGRRMPRSPSREMAHAFEHAMQPLEALLSKRAP